MLNNDTMSDDKVVASYIPPRYLLETFLHIHEMVCPSVRRSHTIWISEKSKDSTKMEQNSTKNIKLYHLDNSDQIARTNQMPELRQTCWYHNLRDKKKWRRVSGLILE